ncbi:hypothetical protein G7Y89_g13869 [Cudoniella acicularis]|uniref:Nucleoside 2-deoxyribosyltransferase domain-containing protein n=1 Tax=Cudoniella acicularis TaxID=354080 RepID=A0A8H4R638_9HELO|nr:hypothetical protein G7Y89_g13869 [Cudoniella acicularis]
MSSAGRTSTAATKCTIIKAPEPLPSPLPQPSLFLSGSISPWRDHIISELSYLPITILNPLRPDWDSSWKEELSSPEFVEQVTWEITALESADVVAIYFSKETKAPITLLELGFVVGRAKKIVVCCEVGYEKRGNVELLCQALGYKVVEALEDLVEGLKVKLGEVTS